MLTGVEEIAIEAGLRLRATYEWSGDGDWPHIAPFSYDVRVSAGGSGRQRTIGTVDGYRIVQDWTVENAMALWDEADALDGDVVRYVEALIRELRACELLLEDVPSLTMAQRVTIIRHIDARPGQDLASLTRSVTASLAMMDAPVFMLVDPSLWGEQRRRPEGKLIGRGNAARLLELGFRRMVGSRFLWAWNTEIADIWLQKYDYEELLAAKRAGRLDAALKAPLAAESYGSMNDDVARMMDLPLPEDLDE